MHFRDFTYLDDMHFEILMETIMCKYMLRKLRNINHAHSENINSLIMNF